LALATMMVAVIGWALRGQVAPARAVPTTHVVRGSLEMTAIARGEFRPERSAMLVAPMGGSSFQIIALAETGTRVEAGDVVVELDPAQLELDLQQARSKLAEIEQELRKGKAEAEVRAGEDEVALIQARFARRKAELQVSRNELVSAIDARKNLLALEEAERHLAQLQSDVVSRQASSQAALEVLHARRAKALLDRDRALRLLGEIQLRCPIAGLVSVHANRDAAGGFFYTGMVLPDFRVGDQVNPGTVVAEVVGGERMTLQVQLDEADRAGVSPGQAAEVRPEALPGTTLTARVANAAAMSAAGGFFRDAGAAKFGATLEMDSVDARLRPGMTAEVTIRGEQAEGLLLPRQCVFEQEGKWVAYVRHGERFEAQPVEISHRSATRVAISGLQEGTEVALVNPEKDRQSSARPASRGPALAGGG
jgi:multidrug efflux pump subunit AcrA (membrane-fusion protein)